MNNTAQQLLITEQEYLDGERHSEIKHEFIDGYVYAMTGATDDHNIISGNFYVALHQQLRGQSCQPFIADVQVKAGSRYFYPDVMVLCDPDDADTPYIKHAPTVIVEVLSPTTRKTDITIKKIAYLNLPSLQEYVLIEQDKCEVVVFRRNEGWTSTYYIIGDVITLDSIDISISVAEIYQRVENDDMAAFLAENQPRLL
jgi:Uma2 family endonuclease